MLLWARPTEVGWVPSDQIGDVIKAFGYFLLRGLKAADLTLDQLVEDLANNQCWLGVAFETEPFRPLGIWVTDLRYDEDSELNFATIYGLSGERLPAWTQDFERIVTDFALANKCKSVRFFGRAAYRSLIEDLDIIGKSEDGRALLFEKKIAA